MVTRENYAPVQKENPKRYPNRSRVFLPLSRVAVMAMKNPTDPSNVSRPAESNSV